MALLLVNCFPSTANSLINEDSAKDLVFNGMLNSVDYFDRAQGSFVMSFIDNEHETTVQYSTDIPQQMSYESVTNSVTDQEQYVCNGQISTYDNFRKTYKTENLLPIDTTSLIQHRKSFNRKSVLSPRPRDIVEELRVTYDENAIPEYHYRQDLTNTSEARASLFSQELTFGLLSDKNRWDINGVTQYLGRNCIIIVGVGTHYYQTKLNIYNFTMYVDEDTGILLKFNSYDAAGEVSQYIETTEIAIDAAIPSSLSINSVDKYEGYILEQRSITQQDTSMKINRVAPESGFIRYSTATEEITDWEIDNDTNASKASNERYGFPTYLTTNTHLYNGDARRELSSNKSSYVWKLDNESAYNLVDYQYLYIKVGVYLWDDTFTDSNAKYYGGNDLCTYLLFTIDQNKAAPGWTYYNTSFNTSYEFPGSFKLNRIKLETSGNANQYTGADGIRVYTHTVLDASCACKTI